MIFSPNVTSDFISAFCMSILETGWKRWQTDNALGPSPGS